MLSNKYRCIYATLSNYLNYKNKKIANLGLILIKTAQFIINYNIKEY